MSETDRIRWRCRRGMRELDVLLTRYLDKAYPGATADEQAGFRRLLEYPDPLLFACLMGRTLPPDDEVGHVIARIRDCR